MKRCRAARSAIVLGFFFVPACGRHPLPGTLKLDSDEPDRIRSSRASIATLERRDFAPYHGRSLADAVAQLRPDWLRPNPAAHPTTASPTPVLYVNDVLVGEFTWLRTLPSEVALEARLLSRSEAWVRYGPPCRCPAGVILVRTRSYE